MSFIHERNVRKLTRLRNEDIATPTEELKISLQSKLHEIQLLLEDAVMLQVTAQIGCSGYIQRVNNLTLEAGAKLQVLIRHKERTTNIRRLKRSINPQQLTQIKTPTPTPKTIHQTRLQGTPKTRSTPWRQ